MTTRTRYFVIASLLVLTVGLGTGLVAYYTGFQMTVLARKGGPQELQYIPNHVAIVAYADVHEVMTSELRQRIHQVLWQWKHFFKDSISQFSACFITAAQHLQLRVDVVHVVQDDGLRSLWQHGRAELHLAVM